MTAGVSSGTGFIFDTTGETGFVVTSYHVVDEAPGSIDVVVEGQGYTGTLLGYASAAELDVAVISICCNPHFHQLPWEAGAEFEMGDQVMAMGRPRDVPVSTTGEVVFDAVPLVFDVDLVSHNAPIQRGSSGGPLLSMDGKVLGVNVAGSTERDNIFYAVPYASIADQVEDWKSSLVVLPTPTPVVLEYADMWVELTSEDNALD